MKRRRRLYNGADRPRLGYVTKLVGNGFVISA